MTTDIDLEQAVLGTVFLYPETAVSLVQALEISDFAAQEHRMVFEAVQARLAEGGLPTPMSMTPLFGTMKFGGLLPAIYIGRLVTVGQPAKIAMDSARQLRELAARRRLLEIGTQITEAASTLSSPLGALAADVVSAMDEVQSRLRSS